nr:hypothetical protein [Novosphingobium sp. Gsoil 351]
MEIEPAVRAAYERAVAATDLPAADLILPASLDAIRLAAFAQIGRSLAAELGQSRHGDGVSRDLAFVIEAALALPANPPLLGETRAALREALGEDGVLILPTAPQAAFPHTPAHRRASRCSPAWPTSPGCLPSPARRAATARVFRSASSSSAPKGARRR